MISWNHYLLQILWICFPPVKRFSKKLSRILLQWLWLCNCMCLLTGCCNILCKKMRNPTECKQQAYIFKYKISQVKILSPQFPVLLWNRRSDQCVELGSTKMMREEIHTGWWRKYTHYNLVYARSKYKVISINLRSMRKGNSSNRI